jgi:pyroglutamyl-peptidase
LEIKVKRLLITGFEPFGGESINPSWEAVRLLPDVINGYIIDKLLLPVVFTEAAERVIETAEKIRPDVILCIGQAGGRAAITPEIVGINLRYAKIPDNKGNEPKDEPIIPGGQDAYFSTVPVRKIAEAIKALGIPSEVSYSAGAYVCNDVLYTLLHHFKDGKTKVGFIHIPYSKEQEKEPSMDLSDITKGLMIAIENID